MISDDIFEQVTALCYEIYGDAENEFNLISDDSIQVNYAEYSGTNISVIGNVISRIAVIAYDVTDDCIKIEVGMDDCVSYVNEVPVDSVDYNLNEIVVSNRNQDRVCIRRTYPAGDNCDNDMVTTIWGNFIELNIVHQYIQCIVVQVPYHQCSHFALCHYLYRSYS